jgi:hypothetical protein
MSLTVDYIHPKYREEIENFDCSDETKVENFLKEEAQKLLDSNGNYPIIF